jgi:hypothetical protein
MIIVIAENINPQTWLSEHPLQANEPRYLIISDAEALTPAQQSARRDLKQGKTIWYWSAEPV